MPDQIPFEILRVNLKSKPRTKDANIRIIRVSDLHGFPFLIICCIVLRKVYSFRLNIWERPFCVPRTVANMAALINCVQLKSASAHKTTSSVACTTNHSHKQLYYTFLYS